ncbi:MAG TPA: sigma-54 dependent transcriptional regulator [Stenotrophomonas sp.]
MRTPRLAIVDDDIEFCGMVVDMARRKGIAATGMHSVQQARGWLQEHDPDLLLLDWGLPDGTGFDVLERLDAPRRQGRVIVVTGQQDGDMLSRMAAYPTESCWLKPLAPARLGSRLDELLGPACNDETACWGLLGQSAAMVKLRDEIAIAGPADVNVLISGETGTGKELVAQALHAASGRKGRFVAVNCGALPPELMASQLFGHERGSFTGADRRHAGFLEQAAHGTLFLDEIGDMPSAMQVYLLRALESRTFMRIGGTEELPMHARVLAATHRPLCSLREDLFYRFNEYPLHVPSLRERPEDILPLALHFIDAFKPEGAQGPPADPVWLSALAQQPWPGNVRELRSHVRYACLRGSAGLVGLPAALRGALPAASDGVFVPASATLREAEALLVQAALQRLQQNKSAAARSLGISTRTIHNHLAQRRQAMPRDD